MFVLLCAGALLIRIWVTLPIWLVALALGFTGMTLIGDVLNVVNCTLKLRRLDHRPKIE